MQVDQAKDHLGRAIIGNIVIGRETDESVVGCVHTLCGRHRSRLETTLVCGLDKVCVCHLAIPTFHVGHVHTTACEEPDEV